MLKNEELEYSNEGFDSKKLGYDLKNDRFHYFVGESNVNQQSVSGQYFKKMAVGLLIDTTTGDIIDCNVTMISPVGKNFVCAQLCGRNILNDYEAILVGLNRYHSTTQKSIIVAFKQVYDIYKKWVATNDE